MEEKFKVAAAEVTKLPNRASDKEKLEVYGLYKQAVVGDINIPCPEITDLKGRAKWDAWNNVKGTTKEEAMKKYVALAENLKAKYT